VTREPRPDARPSYPGEPGIGPDLPPPFAATDEAVRWLFALNRFGIRPGLQRIEGLLAGLGHPERGLPTLVVAGTNGKGSTTRILTALLRAAGHHVATYTSPHLLRVHERLTLDDVAVDPALFAARVTAIRPLVERHEASWFETLTAVSVQIAREAGVDVLVCETGLGGRLDASNALPAEATLLTTVDLDHQKILGETREEILAEKLGLLKAGVPFFCGIDADLRPQAFRAAIEAGSPCHFLDELTRTEDENDATWRLLLRDRVYAGLPRLPVPAMRRNTALALLALDHLARQGRFRLPDDPAAALQDLFLPGRFQRVLTGPDWYVDTAHNAQALRGALDTLLGLECRGRRIVLLGAMHDKPAPPDLAARLQACDAVTAATVALPRSRNREGWEGLFTAWGLDGPSHSILDSVPAALEYWGPRLDAEDVVLVTGSCFMVAETLHALGFRDLEETRTPRAARTALRL